MTTDSEPRGDLGVAIAPKPEPPKEVTGRPKQETFEQLAKLHEGLEEIIGAERGPFPRLKRWEDDVRTVVKTNLPNEDPERFLIVGKLLHLSETSGEIERLPLDLRPKLRSAHLQRVIANHILIARNNPKVLKLLEWQVKYIEHKMRTSSLITGWDLGIVNGVRGLVAVAVALDRPGARLLLTKPSWDVLYGIDLLVRSPSGAAGIAIHCQKGFPFTVERVPFESEPPDLRRQLKRKIYIGIRAPAGDFDPRWESHVLGIPNEGFVLGINEAYNTALSAKADL